MKPFAIVAAILVGLVVRAEAGWKYDYNVSITYYSEGGYAIGAFGTVRNSADNNQYIGCSVEAIAERSAMSCRASNMTGDWVYCWSASPIFVAAASGMSDEGLVQFSWDENGQCNWFSTDKSSMWAAKAP